MAINEGPDNDVDPDFQQVLACELAKSGSNDYAQAILNSTGVSLRIVNTLAPQSTEQFALLLGISFPRTANSTPLDIDLSE